jgi:hypothetical protein
MKSAKARRAPPTRKELLRAALRFARLLAPHKTTRHFRY